jgi:hypothetical protein
MLLPLLLIVLPAVLYLLTLRRAITICAPENQRFSPALVWLLLLPAFNLLWHFFVVLGVSRSTRGEFLRRRAVEPPRSTLLFGLAMCTLSVLAFVPGVGGLAGLGAFAAWIVYWIKVAHDTREITTSPEVQLEA